jgi:hypothetical protein
MPPLEQGQALQPATVDQPERRSRLTNPGRRQQVRHNPGLGLSESAVYINIRYPPLTDRDPCFSGVLAGYRSARGQSEAFGK